MLTEDPILKLEGFDRLHLLRHYTALEIT